MSADPHAAGSAAERLAALRQRAATERPESWVPKEPGDELAGELVRYDRGETSYGEQIIAIVRTLDGSERGVWLLHAVLRDEFAKVRPAPGELLLVRFEGKRMSAAGQSYASYRLELDREPVAPDWAAIAGEPGEQLEEPQRQKERPPDRGDDDIPF